MEFFISHSLVLPSLVAFAHNFLSIFSLFDFFFSARRCCCLLFRVAKLSYLSTRSLRNNGEHSTLLHALLIRMEKWVYFKKQQEKKIAKREQNIFRSWNSWDIHTEIESKNPRRITTLPLHFDRYSTLPLTSLETSRLKCCVSLRKIGHEVQI